MQVEPVGRLTPLDDFFLTYSSFEDVNTMASSVMHGTGGYVYLATTTHVRTFSLAFDADAELKHLVEQRMEVGGIISFGATRWPCASCCLVQPAPPSLVELRCISCSAAV